MKALHQFTLEVGKAPSHREKGWKYDRNEDEILAGRPMAQLTVRKIGQELADALERRAAANGRSTEAEHREILRASLLGVEGDFAARAEALRRRLRSSVDSSSVIRAARDGGS